MSDSRAQLQAIRSLLEGGHRSVRLERHTFWLWGLTGAALVLVVPGLFSPSRFPAPGERILAQSAVIAGCLLVAGVLDWRLTRRARERRGETLPFAQRQVTRVWWLLVALIVVINIGMNRYGGGLLFYPVTLVLVGIALYVQGLFSRQMLSWGGGLLIVLGLSLAATGPDLATQQRITASALGIGLPYLSLLVQGPPRGRWHELGLSALWLAAVLAPPLLDTAWQRQDGTPAAVIDHADYLRAGRPDGPPPAAVRLPAGATLPVRLVVHGDTLAADALVPMTLRRPVIVQPATDRLRFGGPWRDLERLPLRGALHLGGRLLADGDPVRIDLTLQFGD